MCPVLREVPSCALTLPESKLKSQEHILFNNLSDIYHVPGKDTENTIHLHGTGTNKCIRGDAGHEPKVAGLKITQAPGITSLKPLTPSEEGVVSPLLPQKAQAQTGFEEYKVTQQELISKSIDLLGCSETSDTHSRSSVVSRADEDWTNEDLRVSTAALRSFQVFALIQRHLAARSNDSMET
ncbi:hypothetical protein H920_14759 [Fukomys damarensis]|uniref:Uncharacterized protein n=1 Tax=Fukomys damarensis TaxID=885580 RepID=A0A091CVZ2_FUKDA|nr:hypothetical protein H920_14759 [Fukomys damarensis]